MKNFCFLPHLKGIYPTIEEVILNEKIAISDKKIAKTKFCKNAILQKKMFSKNNDTAFENTLKQHLSAEENRMSISCMVMKIVAFLWLCV